MLITPRLKRPRDMLKWELPRLLSLQLPPLKEFSLTLGTEPHVVNDSQWPKVLASMTGSQLHSASTFSVTQMLLPPKVKDMDLDNSEAPLKITLTCSINTTSRQTPEFNLCFVCFPNTCSLTDQTVAHKHFTCSPLMGKHWR